MNSSTVTGRTLLPSACTTVIGRPGMRTLKIDIAGVDEAQAHPFAWTKEAGPVFIGSMPVDEIGIGGASHICDVGGIHAHPPPHQPILERHHLLGVAVAKQAG